MSFLFYKRPPAVPKQDGHLSELKASNNNNEQNIGSKNPVPPELSFENVICNKCSPPCSLQDFLDYLTYIAHDAENLQFYLWMIDYFQRFRRIAKMERALSPRWTGRAPPIKEQNGLRMIATHEVDIMSEDISDCDTWGGYEVYSEFTDQYTQTLDDIKFSISPVKTAVPRPEQFVWHPAEDQPCRGEITRIINHYLLPGSPRQLNLSHNDRATVLRALEYTTHPSALSPIKKMLDSTLRNHSHPNFIRWSICNGTRQWVLFLRILASSTILLAFLMTLLLLLSHANRFYRLFAAPFWWYGIFILLTSSRGLCVILFSLHARQSHAWEAKAPAPKTSSSKSSSSKRNKFGILDDEDDLLKTDFSTIMSAGGAISYESTRPSFPVKMEVFGPSNNYSGEAWVAHHESKGWWRKIWEYRVRTQEEGLSAIQKTMAKQAAIWAAAGTVPLIILFVAIPNANVI